MLLITLRDSGKGIPNLDEIMGGKYVSKTGMGLGMIGAKRLMDHFQVETKPREPRRARQESPSPLHASNPANWINPLQHRTRLAGSLRRAAAAKQRTDADAGGIAGSPG